jgi:hypothetical protein
MEMALLNQLCIKIRPSIFTTMETLFSRREDSGRQKSWPVADLT